MKYIQSQGLKTSTEILENLYFLVFFLKKSGLIITDDNYSECKFVQCVRFPLNLKIILQITVL